MPIAVLMTVCEGEDAIAWDTLSCLAQACTGARLSLFLIDDASQSCVGRRLAERFRETTGHAAECHELPKSLGFRGIAQRLFLGLSLVAERMQAGDPFDMLVKLDPDACIVRSDLLPFLKQTCPDGVGFFGELSSMRWRDIVLLLADYMPAGFTRKRVGGVIQRDWRLQRYYPVWWSDFGRRSILRGFRLSYIIGGFCILGGRTLLKLNDAGWLTRDQTKHGFTFSDDILLTIAAYAIGDPVVDLCATSPHWGFLATTEDTPLEQILPHRPYVVHALKERPKAWERRRELRSCAQL